MRCQLNIELNVRRNNMYNIVLIDNECYSVGCIDVAETFEEAVVLKAAYAEDYPVDEGYEIDLEEV